MTSSEVTDVCAAYISPSILAGRKFQDADVCHGQSAAGAFVGDLDQSQICDQGTQHAHWDSQAAGARS